MARRRRFEWHLVSAASIWATLTFISIQTTVSGSTPQTIAAAFSAIVGGLVLASKQWRDMAREFHIAMIGISVFAFLLWLIWILGANNLFDKNYTLKQVKNEK